MLSSSVEDFDSSDEIYEAIGEILHEVASGDKTEDDIRLLCTKFHTILKPENEKINNKNRKILDAPMILGEMAANVDSDIENMTSIWVQQRNDCLVSNHQNFSYCSVLDHFTILESRHEEAGES